MVIHVLGCHEAIGLDIWDLLVATDSFSMKSGACNVQLLEHKWFNIFVILPFVDIDAHGTAREETRRLKVTSRWSIVEDLLRQAERRNARYATLNDYTRSVFARCFVLITKWGWTEAWR
jgi:Mus7/MMS22 family